LSRTNVKVRVLSLNDALDAQNEAKDPDEFIQKYGAERFEQLLEGSGNPIEYEPAKAKKKCDLTAADGRAAYVRAALDVLAARAGPAEQDIYAGRIAQEADVAKAAVLTQLESVIRQRQKRWARERERRMKDEGLAAGIDRPYSKGDTALGVVFAEQQLVAAVLKSPQDYLALAAARVQPQQMLSPEMAEAYTLMLQKGREGEYFDLTTLSAELPDKTVALLGKILALNYDIGFSRKDVELFIERILGGRPPVSTSGMTEDALKAHLAAVRERKLPKEEN